MTLRLENQTISTVSIYDNHISLPEILMPKNKLVQTQGVNNRLFLRPKSAHLPILRPVDWRPGNLNIYCYSYIYIYTHIPIYYHIYHTYIYHILPRSFFCPDVPPLVTEQQGWSPHRAKGPGGFGGPITGIPRGGTSWKHKQPHQHVYVSIIYIYTHVVNFQQLWALLWLAGFHVHFHQIGGSSGGWDVASFLVQKSHSAVRFVGDRDSSNIDQGSIHLVITLEFSLPSGRDLYPLHWSTDRVQCCC